MFVANVDPNKWKDTCINMCYKTETSMAITKKL